MKILTPLQSALLTAKARLTEDVFFTLQKEIINSYAEGFYSANYGEKSLKDSLLNSNTLREIGNIEFNEWVKKVCS